MAEGRADDGDAADGVGIGGHGAQAYPSRGAAGGRSANRA
jgi:hypothetical protein